MWREGDTLLVEIATELADDKKAIDIVELAVSEAVGYTDYFLICSGSNITPRMATIT